MVDKQWADQAIRKIVDGQTQIVEHLARQYDWANNSPEKIAIMKARAAATSNALLADPLVECGVMSPIKLTVAEAVVGGGGIVGHVDIVIDAKVKELDLKAPSRRGDNPQWITIEKHRKVAITLERPSDAFVDVVTRVRSLQAYKKGENIVWCVIGGEKERKDLYEKQDIIHIYEPLV
jgi:hypothetical protein